MINVRGASPGHGNKGLRSGAALSKHIPLFSTRGNVFIHQQPLTSFAMLAVFQFCRWFDYRVETCQLHHHSNNNQNINKAKGDTSCILIWQAILYTIQTLLTFQAPKFAGCRKTQRECAKSQEDTQRQQGEMALQISGRQGSLNFRCKIWNHWARTKFALLNYAQPCGHLRLTQPASQSIIPQ